MMEKFLNYTLDYSEVPFQGMPSDVLVNDYHQPLRMEGRVDFIIGRT